MGTCPQLPACSPQATTYEDSYCEKPNSQKTAFSTFAAHEADPAWQDEQPLGEEAPLQFPKAKPAFHFACSQARFLVSSSGVAHTCITHPGSRMVCLACISADRSTRCHPACGASRKFPLLSTCPRSTAYVSVGHASGFVPSHSDRFPEK